MSTVTLVDTLDEAARASVGALLAGCETYSSHPALADAKVVEVRAQRSTSGFTALAHEGDALAGLVVAIRPDADGDPDVWSLQAAVHPTFATLGVLDEVAESAVSEAWRRGARRVQWWAVQAEDDDDDLAARLGFAFWRDVVQMRRPLPHPEAPSFPDDVALRAFAPGKDEDHWLAVNRVAFAAHPEQRTYSRADLAARMAEAWFDPSDFLVAEDADGMCGFCWVKVLPGGRHGEIYVIAAHPRRQGEGLGRALTLAGLTRMTERGLAEARLYVDGANGAGLALYETLGFHRDHVDRAYAAEQ